MDNLLKLISGFFQPQTFKYDFGRATQQPQDLQQALVSPSPSATPMPKPVKGKGGRNPDIAKYSIPDTVHQAIQGAAGKYGVPQDLLYDIALSEGGFRPDAQNTTPEGQAVGVPVGLYQYTPNTWNTVQQYANKPNSSLALPANAKREDPILNALATAYLVKFGQLGRWQASKPNWGRFYNEDELEPFYSQTQGYEKGKTFK